MFINKVLHTPDGTVTFNGELTEEELNFALAVGLNTLMAQGAIPFTQDDQEEDFDIPDTNESGDTLN